MLPPWMLEGSIATAPTNLGDPGFSSIVLENGASFGEGIKCLDCEEIFFSGVEVLSGRIRGTVSDSLDSMVARRARQFAAFVDESPGIVAEWRHGFLDAHLEQVDEFLDRFDFPIAEKVAVGPEESDEAFTARMERNLARQRMLASTVAEGSERFSREAVIFATARKLEIDPFFLSVQLFRSQGL